METDTKKQRQHFYRHDTSGQWSMSESCGRYPICRPTSYKWIDRIETEGLKAAAPESRWKPVYGIPLENLGIHRETENRAPGVRQPRRIFRVPSKVPPRGPGPVSLLRLNRPSRKADVFRDSRARGSTRPE
jgi:hypothetical protein